MPLNTLLSDILKSSKQISLNVYYSFLIMFELGIRHAELNRESIIINQNNTILIICKKNSEVRTITTDSISIEIYDFLKTFTNKDVILCRSVLSNHFKTLSFPYRIYKENKNICLHSFRYNYIKNLYDITQDINEVKKAIGHKDIKNTQMYVDSNLIINKM